MMKLPLRIRPNRTFQILGIFFYLFGAGILVWSMVFELSTEGSLGQQLSPGIQLLSWLFMIAFLLGMLAGIGAAVLRLLPGSPLVHLELTADSMASRWFLKIQCSRWKELGAFVVTTHPNNDDVTCIIAMAPGDSAGNEKDLYERARFRLRSNPYCSSERARILADWLNEVRLAMTDLRVPVPQVSVPPAFAANVQSARGGHQAKGPKPMASVIER